MNKVARHSQSKREDELHVHPRKSVCIATQGGSFAAIPVSQYPAFAGVSVHMMQCASPDDAYGRG